MSLLTDIHKQIEDYTARAKLVSNHTTSNNPEAWRNDNEPGRWATFLEAIANEIKLREEQIADLDCQGEWCGKSPRKDDDGLCGVCKMQKEIFVDYLQG